MPDEAEVPLEDVQDRIAEEHPGHAHASEPERSGWIRLVGVSTALFAVVAAIGALYVVLSVRGQYAFDNRLIPQAEEVGAVLERLHAVDVLVVDAG